MTTVRENITETYNRYSILTSESALNVNISTNVHRVKKHISNKHRYTKENNLLTIFSTNGAGIVGGKMSSLRSQVKKTQANVVTLQETHAKRKGKIQLHEMVVFEAIRKSKGGGTLVAGHKSLNPKLIEVYEDEFELIVVELELKERNIRIITGYGPQENWSEDKKKDRFLLH